GFEHPGPGDAGAALVPVYHGVGAGALGGGGSGRTLGTHAATAPWVRYIRARPTSSAAGVVRPCRSAEDHASRSTRSSPRTVTCPSSRARPSEAAAADGSRHGRRRSTGPGTCPLS